MLSGGKHDGDGEGCADHGFLPEKGVAPGTGVEILLVEVWRPVTGAPQICIARVAASATTRNAPATTSRSEVENG